MGRKPRSTGPFHVVTTRRQGKQREYVAHLLRRSYREGGKVQKETVANLSHLPDEVIELIRGALRGQRFVAAEEALAVERSLPAGHVEAALAMARRLELSRLLDRRPSRSRRSRPSSQSRMLTRTSSTKRSTGCLPAKAGSSGRSRAATWKAARSCSTTSPPPTSRVTAARWRSSATRATGAAARRRSSTGCSASGAAVRSR